MDAYYERRAPEYDDWYRGTGLFADRDRPGWHAELRDLVRAISSLSPATTLDVACGTGFVTRSLPGRVVGLDRSDAMLRIARGRVAGPVVRADGLALPFRDGSFERVFAGHAYGHLEGAARGRFLEEARRVADELVVLDTARREGVGAEEHQVRVLSDGSRHRVYKRFFDAGELGEEIGGGRPLFAGRWFVLVASPVVRSAPGRRRSGS